MLEVIHSPRLEDLADQLAEQLRAQRRRQVENILQPITVVVGHLGIARWLEQRIAARFGIFANVRFMLTGEWLNAEMARFGVLDKHDAERFSLGAMTWALYALLETPERFGLVSDKPLLERERFQLAAKLARLYSEYLIYRREWLLDFEAEAVRAPPRHMRAETRADTRLWQGRLWCAMSAQLKGQHRAAKFQASLNAITNLLLSGVIAAPTYFFGLNHLPPDVLTLLERLSESASVQIYFPNPCVEYWADVVRERFLVQRRLGGDLLSTSVEDPSGFDHFDVGHPLLASLGGHGQAYFAELSHATGHFIELQADVQRGQDQPVTPTLLTALQHGIAHLQPDFAPALLHFDHSIQVFSANSIVDELSRVKAILFAVLLEDPNLRLEEIAIMTPNLSRYAPLLAAVFGAELSASPTLAPAQNRAAHAGPRAQSALRYSVLDLAAANFSPLLQQLLQAPELRWEPPQLLALLNLEEVATHFALDANDLSQAPRLLERAHIAFGFNDAHRRQLIERTTATILNEVAPEAIQSASLHTWEAGFERLLFGYLHGNQGELEQGQTDQGESEQATSHERLWPVPDVDVRHAAILGALLQLIRALRVFNFGAQRNRTVPEWTRWLERQILAFTGSAVPDPLRAIFTQLELDAQHADLADVVSFIALREAINAASAQVSGRRTPALGAICVCGLVPMRALPFKVVCILGLDEAEFPKPEMPDALNLMRATGARRPGDRSRAQEDRYLFLEAIMAARSKLVLSYQGLSSDGSTRLPCGVLSELLAQLERQFSARVGARPWLIAAPPSTNAVLRELRAAPVAVMSPGKIAPSERAQDGAQTLKVNELLRFWQQPLRDFVQQRLRLATQQTQAQQLSETRNQEPLSLATLPIERIEARLLVNALDGARFPETAPPWLGRSGLLPSGALGLQSYAGIEEACRPAWLAIKAKFPEFLGALKQPVRVDLNLGATRLTGYIPGVYRAQRACVCVSNKALHGLQRWQLLLRVLLLRASEADPESGTDADAPPWRALHLGPKAAELHIYASPSEARDYLSNLIALRNAYLQQDSLADGARKSIAPPWFWPRLSYTAFAAKGDAHEAVAKVIEAGNDYELASSGLKFWLPNATFFEAESAEFAEFLALAKALFAPFARSIQPANVVSNPHNDASTLVATDINLPKPDAPKPSAPHVVFDTFGHEPEPVPVAPLQSASPKTLDLEQFGHDGAADFNDAY